VEPPPALATAPAWWAAVRCLVLLASRLASPAVAEAALASHPTLRALLQMLATGCRRFPIVGGEAAAADFRRQQERLQVDRRTDGRQAGREAGSRNACRWCQHWILSMAGESWR
jgi:hypothetical protein